MDYPSDFSHTIENHEKSNCVAGDALCTREGVLDFILTYPSEIEDHISQINDCLFGEVEEGNQFIDALIVMGSQKCKYKIDKALEIGKSCSNMVFIVSGGNLYEDNQQTEAEFMSSYLKAQGVDEALIYKENYARYSKENLILSAALLSNMEHSGINIHRIGILTSGFHIPRTKLLVEQTKVLNNKHIVYFAAYASKTRKDTWYKNEKGKKYIIDELRKTIILQNELSC